MRDCYYQGDMGTGNFEGGTREIITLTNREPGSPLMRIYELQKSLASHTVVFRDRISLLPTQRESETQSPKNARVGG